MINIRLFRNDAAYPKSAEDWMNSLDMLPASVPMINVTLFPPHFVQYIVYSVDPAPADQWVPPQDRIVADNGGIWTIENGVILLNGAEAAGGRGSIILRHRGLIYVLGTDNNWYRWDADRWTNTGENQP